MEEPEAQQALNGKEEENCSGNRHMNARLAQEWAEEEVFNLYVARGAEGIVQNVFCRQNAGVFSVDLPGAPPLHIKQNRDLQSIPGMTGAAVWDGSIVLGAYLVKQRKRLGLSMETTVLELGSGCGLLGIYLHRSLNIERVLLTDMEAMLPLLNQNMQLNDCKPSVKSMEITWGEENDIGEIMNFFISQGEEEKSESKFGEEVAPCYFPDFIVAADCVYTESLITPLVQTLLQFCGPKTIVFLAVSLRDSNVMEMFLAEMAQYFVMSLVDREECDQNFNPVALVIYKAVKRGNQADSTST